MLNQIRDALRRTLQLADGVPKWGDEFDGWRQPSNLSRVSATVDVSNTPCSTGDFAMEGEMPHINNIDLLEPKKDANKILVNQNPAKCRATNNEFNRREFERIQLLCQLGLPIRQFLPAVLPYLRELIPASCAFVLWNDTSAGSVLFSRESPRAITFEINTPEAVMAQRVLREHFSGAAHRRRCHLIPPDKLGLEGSQSTYRPSITAVLAVGLGTIEVPSGYLCLCRNVFARPFSRAEQSSLVGLAPVFTHTLSCDVDAAVATTCALSSESGMFVANIRGQVQVACARAKKFLSMVLESQPHLIAGRRELPSEIKQHFADIFNPIKPTEAVWCYRNAWGDFLFRARLLRETSDPASRSVAVTITREEPLSLHVFRKCRQLSLTPRQTEIVLALARGDSFPLISKQLKISTHTVIDHVRKLCCQFGVSNRYALVVFILT